MASKAETFTYKPLKKHRDFRLLELLPGKRGGPLKCSLNHTSLALRPEFCAVSYAWGELGRLKEIQLNGASHSVRENLHDFIQAVRLLDRPRTIWVDAICINQNDIPEKNDQVPLMREIYMHAQSVLLWLEPSPDGSAEFFEFCYETIVSELSLEHFVQKRVSDEALRRSFMSLLQRPYWTRTWIIQEVVLASNIRLQCGHRTIPWLDFAPVALQCLKVWPVICGRRISPFEALCDLRKIGTGSDLLDVLEKTHHAKCTDLRDQIYGIMGLAKLHPNSKLVVEYTSSLEDIFLRALTGCGLQYDRSRGYQWLDLLRGLQHRLGLNSRGLLSYAKEIIPNKLEGVDLLLPFKTKLVYFPEFRISLAVLSTEDSAEKSHRDVKQPWCAYKCKLYKSAMTRQFEKRRVLLWTRPTAYLRTRLTPDNNDLTILFLESRTLQMSIGTRKRLAFICETEHDGFEPVIMVRGVGMTTYEDESDQSDLIRFIDEEFHSLIGLMVEPELGEGADQANIPLHLLHLIKINAFDELAASFDMEPDIREAENEGEAMLSNMRKRTRED